MVIFKKSIPRRTFLRGAGAALALPMLDAMTPAFAAAATRPIRMAFMQTPNGIFNLNNEWTPKAEGADCELTRTLEPLAAFKDRMMVLSGLDHQQAAGLNWRSGRRPSARLHRLADGNAREDDLRRRPPRRHLGRPDRGEGIRQIHPARLARDRSGDRQKSWAPASRPMAAPITTRSRGATRPRRCRWRTARARSSSVCSATPAPIRRCAWPSDRKTAASSTPSTRTSSGCA